MIRFGIPLRQLWPRRPSFSSLRQQQRSLKKGQSTERRKLLRQQVLSHSAGRLQGKKKPVKSGSTLRSDAPVPTKRAARDENESSKCGNWNAN